MNSAPPHTPRHRRALIVGAIALGLFAVADAGALMPPHLRGSTPPSGAKLKGKKIVLHGYSLRYANRKAIRIVDVRRKKPVAYSTQLTCKHVGRCGPSSPPGACQQKCDLVVTLAKLPKRTQLKLSFLRAVYTYQTP